jgi:hypothetical protein
MSQRIQTWEVAKYNVYIIPYVFQRFQTKAMPSDGGSSLRAQVASI